MLELLGCNMMQKLQQNVFVSYGVSALSLAMHAWKRAKKEDELLLPVTLLYRPMGRQTKAAITVA